MKKVGFPLSVVFLFFARVPLGAQSLQQFVYFQVSDVTVEEEKCSFSFETEPQFSPMKNRMITLYSIQDDGAFRPTRIGQAPLKENFGQTWTVSNEEFESVNPKEGDLVEVLCAISPKIFQGLLYEVSLKSIQFKTVEEELFFTREEMLEASCEPWEDFILGQMVKDIQFTASAMRGNMDPSPVKSGKYSGMDILDAMEKTDEEDLRGFLSYVNIRPEIYQGHTWKISEVYATWLDAGSPMPISELKERLEININEDHFSAELSGVFPQAVKEISSQWNSKAEFLVAENKFDEAKYWAELSVLAGKTTNNKEVMGWAYFTHATILAAEEKNNIALAKYSVALKFFNQAGSLTGQVFTLCNIAEIQNDEKNYNKGLKNASQAGELMIEIMSKFEYEIPELNLYYSRIRLEEGKAYLGKGKLDYAEEIFYDGMGMVSGIESKKFIRRTALFLLMLAEVQQKMGKWKEAESATAEGLRLFKLSESFEDL